MQTKAVVGRAGDRWEREADHAADRIAAGQSVGAVSPVSAGALQRDTEEEPVQRKLDEEEPVQAQTVEEEPVQALATVGVPDQEIEEGGGIQAKLDEDEPVQAKDPGGPTATVPSTGSGRPLPPSARAPIERGLGADLGHVRVHDDAAARRAADDLGARAFTHGSDIYLGSGHSSRDVGLMAHESTHVVQQAGGSGMVQREQTTARRREWSDGTVFDADAKEIQFQTLRVPQVKAEPTRDFLTGSDRESLRYVPYRASRPSTQNEQWEARLGDRAASHVAELLAGATRDEHGNAYLRQERGPRRPEFLLVGDDDRIRSFALRPLWDREGRPTRFQIDHVVEKQLGGDDEVPNYWLLEEQANMSSGGAVRAELERRINAVLTKATRARRPPLEGVPASTAELTSDWTWRARNVIGGLPISGRPASSWEVSDIDSGEHMEGVRPMTAEEMQEAGGSAEAIALYLSPFGGVAQMVEWGQAAADAKSKEMSGWWFMLGRVPRPGQRPPRQRSPRHNNYSVSKIDFDPTTGGTIHGELFRRRDGRTGPIVPFEKNLALRVNRALAGADGFSWAGFTDKERFLNEIRTELLEFEGMSPIRIDEADLVPDLGLVARGRLLPTVPLIARAEIDVVINGEDVYLSKRFTAEDFDFPGPIQVDQAGLELRFGTEGFAILGGLDFSIEGLGTGRITGEAGTNGRDVNFGLAGEFDFLSDLFDPARIEVWYREGAFGGRGELGIPEGKVNGLRSASVVAEWNEGTLAATGTFATEMPGVESGQLEFTYREDGTYELGGTLQLGADVPGIDSGTVEVSLARNEAGGFAVVGEITAVPSIPGIASRVTGRYDDGVVTLQATAHYQRGMAEGDVTIGLTNRALDEAGTPSGEPIDELRAFGGGQVTLTLAPWLAATAGLHLLPNGELEVTGEIGLPAALDLFPERSFERNLFSIGLDIPIIGFAVAGQRVGIFATIGGGADLRAYFGPAQLRNLRLGVTWNPDHEDQTTVEGNADLHLPAGAGIRLNVSASIGAGIPVVSARLGMEIGGELGIEAAIGASFDINWTPTTGLLLEAEARAYAEPTFRFDITGFARVDLDLLLKTINLWERRWELAAVEVGSGLRLGMRMPVRYQEGEPFEPSLDDIEFEVPQIEPSRVMRDLIAEVL